MKKTRNEKLQKLAFSTFRERFSQLSKKVDFWPKELGSKDFNLEGLVYLTTRFAFPGLKIMGGGNTGLYFQQRLLLLTMSVREDKGEK